MPDNRTAKNGKKKFPPFSFARGSVSYYVLAFVIFVMLLFGLFDPRTPPGKTRMIGSYGDYVIVASKQGRNVYEVTLQNKDTEEKSEPVPIDNIKNVLWIMAQTFKIQSFHPIEESGKVQGLIITVEEK